jgi:hypothetical protein
MLGVDDLRSAPGPAFKQIGSGDLEAQWAGVVADWLNDQRRSWENSPWRRTSL